MRGVEHDIKRNEMKHPINKREIQARDNVVHYGTTAC